nr:hypothetical protein [Tanacetum cinerariifolium]
MEQLTSMCEMVCQIIQKKQEEKKIKEEQAAKYWKICACCDDDDDYNSVITPNEPIDSLSIRDEHHDTIPATKSDKFIKSCVENLVPNPSESEASMLNHDSLIISSSSKIDSLLDEFADELTLLKSIPLGIDKTDCYPEDEIRFTERLFDSFIEEIDLTFTPDDPMPSGIKDDDYDSERDIIILNELPSNYSLLLPVIESFHFDIPSFPRPLAKPPDGNTGILNIKMMGDIYDQKLSSIPGNLKTLAKGCYPPSLHFLSFN